MLVNVNGRNENNDWKIDFCEEIKWIFKLRMNCKRRRFDLILCINGDVKMICYLELGVIILISKEVGKYCLFIYFKFCGFFEEVY